MIATKATSAVNHLMIDAEIDLSSAFRWAVFATIRVYRRRH